MIDRSRHLHYEEDPVQQDWVFFVVEHSPERDGIASLFAWQGIPGSPNAPSPVARLILTGTRHAMASGERLACRPLLDALS